jgi:RecA/RadA recombinase/intein/homing endonuclease
MAARVVKPVKPEKQAIDPDKNIALQNALANIEKNIGKGSVMRLGDKPVDKVPVITTGCMSLDYALVVGGLPRGRIVEIYGPEGSGKSTLAMQIVAQAQKLGGICAYVDAENAMDLNYAKNIGVNVEDLLLSQPDYGEQGLTIVEELVRSSAIDVIVVDSVAALTPKSEIEGEFGDAQMGAQARMMGQALRKLVSVVAKSKTILIFINQLRCLPENTLLLCDGSLTHLKSASLGSHVLGCGNHSNVIINKISSGVMGGKRLYLKYRGYFDLSNNHKQPIISNGKYTFKKATEVQIGDWFIQPIVKENSILDNKSYISLFEYINDIKVNNNTKRMKLPNNLDEDFAFFLGCYYSDGYILESPESGDYRISFTEKNKERHKLVLDMCNKIFGKDNVYGTPEYISVTGKYLVQFMKNLGIKRYGKYKTIPDIILKSKRSVIISFLRGVFFDTHGFTKGGFIFTNENSESTIQIANVLYYLGIFADIRKDDCDWFNRLYITGQDALKFSSIIGFAEITKQDKCKIFEYDLTARGKYDVVPYEYALNLFNKVKDKGIKNISKLRYYEAYKMCLFKKLNCSRLGLSYFLEFIGEGFDIEREFLVSNRFCQVMDIENVEFEAFDIEVEGDKLFIANQFLTHNSKIGVMFGSNETTTGGNALKFYASIRIDVRRIEFMKDKNSVVVGSKNRIKVVKNKVGPPFREALVEIIFGKGIDFLTDLVNIAVERNVIQKSGSWYSYKEDKIGQGIDSVKEFLLDKPELQEAIQKETEKILFG